MPSVDRTPNIVLVAGRSDQAPSSISDPTHALLTHLSQSYLPPLHHHPLLRHHPIPLWPDSNIASASPFKNSTLQPNSTNLMTLNSPPLPKLLKISSGVKQCRPSMMLLFKMAQRNLCPQILPSILLGVSSSFALNVYPMAMLTCTKPILFLKYFINDYELTTKTPSTLWSNQLSFG